MKQDTFFYRLLSTFLVPVIIQMNEILKRFSSSANLGHSGLSNLVFPQFKKTRYRNNSIGTALPHIYDYLRLCFSNCIRYNYIAQYGTVRSPVEVVDGMRRGGDVMPFNIHTQALSKHLMLLLSILKE
jgi:hypothetical protein